MRPCCSCLFQGKATRISYGRNPSGTIQFVCCCFLICKMCSTLSVLGEGDVQGSKVHRRVNKIKNRSHRTQTETCTDQSAVFRLLFPRMSLTKHIFLCLAILSASERDTQSSQVCVCVYVCVCVCVACVRVCIFVCMCICA